MRENYANIREILGGLIGRRVVDITQHDLEDWKENQDCFVMLHFDDGYYVKFHVGEAGFDHNLED